MAPATSFKLNTGAQIPAVGLGTWQAAPGEVEKAVKHALESGYRHIDAAWMYGNEAEVGKGIKESGVPREEIFITSKLWSSLHNRVEEGLQETLDNLGTDYLDLYLIHWPVTLNPNGNDPKIPTKPDGSRDLLGQWEWLKVWEKLEAIVKTGKVRAIGVSNCSVYYLEKLLETAKVVPAVNQIELHPFNPDHRLKAFCESKGILLTAYSPLGGTGSTLLTDEDIVDIAKKNNVEPGTILISYQVARGCAVLPKSVNPKRIETNLKVIELPKEDLERLEKLAESGKQHRYVKPNWQTDFRMDNW